MYDLAYPMICQPCESIEWNNDYISAFKTQMYHFLSLLLQTMATFKIELPMFTNCMYHLYLWRWNVWFSCIEMKSLVSQNLFICAKLKTPYFTHKYTPTMGSTRSVIDPASLQVSNVDQLILVFICRPNKKLNQFQPADIILIQYNTQPTTWCTYTSNKSFYVSKYFNYCVTHYVSHLQNAVKINSLSVLTLPAEKSKNQKRSVYSWRPCADLPSFLTANQV